VLILACYYLTLARAAVPFVFLGFALLGWVEPILILFGLADLAGGVWTGVALRKAAAAPAARA
jgi:hypothetical protein